MVDKTLLFCSCDGEGLIVYDWREKDYWEVGISLWRYGATYTYGLKWRLHHIWNIIRYGHPYTDDILLNRENAQKLADTLNRLLEETDV